MTVVRDVDGGVPWSKARESTHEALSKFGQGIPWAAGPEAEPDPESWGTDPAAQAALQAMMGMAGGA